MPAAHRPLPFNTWLIVENLDNRRTVEVRVNDRGPFAGSRILDLSYGAARLLGATGPGVIPIRLRVIGGSRSGEDNAGIPSLAFFVCPLLFLKKKNNKTLPVHSTTPS